MADNYDFQIDSLKFRLAEQRNLPYLRTTAPFRKEQLDTSANVGDQSLTGWWTRGQLSFHMGAGLNYYEVLEGEEVLNRYADSQNVEVFEPGEVTLAGALTQVSTSSPKNITAVGIQSLAWVNNLNQLKFLSQPTASVSSIAPNDATTPLRVAGRDGLFYVATNGNKIEEWNTTPAYVRTLYSHTNAARGIWYGKDRIWMLDTLGDLYALAASPSGALPIVPSSPITRLNVTTTGSTHVSFTDSGGAVFLSVENPYIYSFTPSTDGSLATLTAPIVAGILPPDENVKCIRAHMGLLCIVTSRGVRFAAISGSDLTIGPLVVDFYHPQTISIGVSGERVVATGYEVETGYTVAYEFDLAQSLPGNSLAFPYREVWRFNAMSDSLKCGAIEHRRSMAFMSNGILSEELTTLANNTGTLASSGYVTTAYHRFGTLDNKRFQKIVVRAKGSGTIDVYQVTADETETLLGTLNAADAVGTFAIVETDATERLAFKFVLNRDAADATAGPTLLGYQVKALPVPERHELLRVPLVIADFVSLKHGTRVGTQGKGYSDLIALKALENSQAIVTYTDHRTGETGTAYIDSVEFQDNQPATYNDNGFGGYAYVTLRVLE